MWFLPGVRRHLVPLIMDDVEDEDDVWYVFDVDANDGKGKDGKGKDGQGKNGKGKDGYDDKGKGKDGPGKGGQGKDGKAKSGGKGKDGWLVVADKGKGGKGQNVQDGKGTDATGTGGNDKGKDGKGKDGQGGYGKGTGGNGNLAADVMIRLGAHEHRIQGVREEVVAHGNRLQALEQSPPVVMLGGHAQQLDNLEGRMVALETENAVLAEQIRALMHQAACQAETKAGADTVADEEVF